MVMVVTGRSNRPCECNFLSFDWIWLSCDSLFVYFCYLFFAFLFAGSGLQEACLQRSYGSLFPLPSLKQFLYPYILETSNLNKLKSSLYLQCLSSTIGVLTIASIQPMWPINVRTTSQVVKYSGFFTWFSWSIIVFRFSIEMRLNQGIGAYLAISILLNWLSILCATRICSSPFWVINLLLPLLFFCAREISITLSVVFIRTSASHAVVDTLGRLSYWVSATKIHDEFALKWIVFCKPKTR